MNTKFIILYPLLLKGVTSYMTVPDRKQFLSVCELLLFSWKLFLCFWKERIISDHFFEWQLKLKVLQFKLVLSSCNNKFSLIFKNRRNKNVYKSFVHDSKRCNFTVYKNVKVRWKMKSIFPVSFILNHFSKTFVLRFDSHNFEEISWGKLNDKNTLWSTILLLVCGCLQWREMQP